MSWLVRALAPARDELVAAINWYERQHPGLGADFYDAVVEAVATIESHPELGRFDSATKTRRVVVRRFPYQIVYVATDDEIVVIAVAHTKRAPAYWKKRT